MVRAGKVIAQRFRRIRAQEEGAAIAQERQQVERLLRHDFQMFRRAQVGHGDDRVHVLRQDDLAHVLQGRRGNLLAGQFLQLGFHFRGDGAGDALAVRNEDGRRQGIVFGLAQEVRR